MRSRLIRTRLISAFLGLALAWPVAAPPALPLALAPAPAMVGPMVAGLVAAGVTVTADPATAEARAGRSSSGSSRSSGGYSRPGTSSRTPSFSAPSSSVPSSPGTSSGSGGYRRPSLSFPSTSPSPSPSVAPPSGADQAMSRRQGGDALERYRNAGRPSDPLPPASPPPGARRSGQSEDWAGYRNSGGNWGGNWGWGSRPGTGTPGTGTWSGGGWGGGWAPAQGWRVPGYATNTAPRFGVWDGLFLWFLLDHLTRPGSLDFFHNHRDDPGFQQWRTEAEQRAQSDAELRSKLDQLDQQLAARKDQPRDPDYLPPDTPREVAVADGARSTPSAAPSSAPATEKTMTTQGSGFGGGLLIAVLLAGIGVLVVLWFARRRLAAGPAGSAATVSASTAGSVGTAGRILRNALSKETYTPSLFRVGMTLTIDPTPFILAGNAIKVAAPAGGAGGTVSVEAVGRLTAGTVAYDRLYLPGGEGFFQVHSGADGKPDECRYFARIDEVAPASPEEWGFWLDPAEGMIGWPEFQTKDGKLYARHWSPGQARIEPRDVAETLGTAAGETARRLHAMLYSAPTGAAAPAPPTEYILVQAVEEGGRAWVEILAGIDVNTATLPLA